MKLSLRLPRLRQIRELLRLRERAGTPGTGRAPEQRRYALLVAAAGVIAVVVTLIVLTVSFNAQQRRSARQAGEGQSGPNASQAVGELSVDDFLLPALRPASAVPDYYPFRPRLLRWSRENVDRFWVSPRQIAIDTIGTINDRNMESMFEKVP